jgi:hypothetical protein
MKHDNVTKYDAFLRIWNKSAMNDDGIFIESCINFAIANEIQWPTIEDGFWLHSFHSSRVASNLLMVLSPKFVSPRTI